jgi:hypothetical protein
MARRWPAHDFINKGYVFRGVFPNYYPSNCLDSLDPVPISFGSWGFFCFWRQLGRRGFWSLFKQIDKLLILIRWRQWRQWRHFRKCYFFWQPAKGWAFKQSVWQLIGLVVENCQGSATDVWLLFKRANVNTGMKTGIRKPIGDGFQRSYRY